MNDPANPSMLGGYSNTPVMSVTVTELASLTLSHTHSCVQKEKGGQECGVVGVSQK